MKELKIKSNLLKQNIDLTKKKIVLSKSEKLALKLRENLKKRKKNK